MVSHHITRMEKFSGPYRAEYENALKDAAATAFLGKAFLIGMNGYWVLHSCSQDLQKRWVHGLSRMDVFLTESTDNLSIDDIHARDGREPTRLETCSDGN